MDFFKRMDFSTSKPMMVWIYALAMPLIITFITQVPLCHVAFLSTFFKDLPPYTAIQILTAVFILPSYALMAYAIKGTKRKMIHLLCLTVSFVFYLPLLWIFGFYTSRLFFADCVTL